MKIRQGFSIANCFIVPLIALGVANVVQHKQAAKFYAGGAATATPVAVHVRAAAQLTSEQSKAVTRLAAKLLASELLAEHGEAEAAKRVCQ